MFCMSTFLVDIVITSVPFLMMKWNYSANQQLPIKNYAPILWERNFKFNLYDICHLPFDKSLPELVKVLKAT